MSPPSAEGGFASRWGRGRSRREAVCLLGGRSWAQVPLTLLVGQGRVRTLTVEVMSWMQAGQDPLAAAGALFLALPPLLLLAGVALAIRRVEVVVA